MTEIGFKSLAKLVRKAHWFLGLFPELSPNYDKSGWQLTIGVRVPIKASGEKVGERMEHHVIHFERGGYCENPQEFAHWDHGDAAAIKLLFLAELKESKKNQCNPCISIGPTVYGCGKDKGTARAKLETGSSKEVYTVSLPNAGAELHTWGSCEKAQNHCGRDWHPSDADNRSETHVAVTHLQFNEYADE